MNRITITVVSNSGSTFNIHRFKTDEYRIMLSELAAILEEEVEDNDLWHGDSLKITVEEI